MDGIEEPKLLRQYLLGELDDEYVLRQIEERLFRDEDFAERVNVAEEELIEEYLDGDLTAEETEIFHRHFLAAPQRRQQLRLIRDLRRIPVSTEYVIPHRKRSPSERSYPVGWLRFAVFASALLVVAIGVWQFAARNSDVSRGLDELRAAYRDRRPTESRITGLTAYAPYSVTRGDDRAVTDPAALDRAQRYLLDATARNSNARARHALAMYYIAARDLERGKREMSAALEAAPDDAQIQSDAGALFLESARESDAGGDGAAALRSLNESLSHLDRAIALDANLLEARFNKALCLQAMMMQEEAKAAWRDYLERDPNSRWSEEAKQNLRALETATPRERTADELESDLLAAFRAGDRSAATALIASSRELIRDKYLPQRLAMSYLAGPEDRRDELREALRLTGEIEKEHTGDQFASEIAFFYASLPPSEFELLKNAHLKTREGYRLCLDQRYGDALQVFRDAADIFKSKGAEPDEKLARYFVAYALANTRQHDEALRELRSVYSYAASHGYLWLQATVLHWIGQSDQSLTRYSDAVDAFTEALDIAKAIGDRYVAQRNMIALAELHSYCGQGNEALKYLYEALKTSSQSGTSLRQRYRNFADAFVIASRVRLFQIALPAALEAVDIAEASKDAMWTAQSRGYAGVAFAANGDLSAARRYLTESRAKAASIADEATREKVVAFSLLRSADVEYLAEDYRAAEGFYLQATQYYDGAAEMPRNQEQAHVGLLKTYMVLGETGKLGEQIPVNIRIAEERRTRLRDEGLRIGFLDQRQNVYDIASEFELSRGNVEAAYDYAELSSSRSLLDRIKSGSSQDLVDDAPAPPKKIADIRRELPEATQLLQYSVFDDKTVIWLVTREGLRSAIVDIRSKDLEEIVGSYVGKIARPGIDDADKQTASARELYDLLIGPVRGQLVPQTELAIAPSRFLLDLPFAALTAPDGKPLISEFALVYGPSANVFLASTRAAAERINSNKESLLAVGDPAFDRATAVNVPALKDAEAEVTALASRYASSRILVRGAATKAAFNSFAAEADVIHFAGHYIVVPGVPMSSYMLMAKDDGSHDAQLLTNAELARMPLARTRLIVLAACETRAEVYAGGEGMAGASRAILAAKVPLVVSSQWSVDSAATAELMRRFHTYRQRDGLSTAEALRRAQLDLVADPSGRFRSPFYWAAFSVFGGHAGF